MKFSEEICFTIDNVVTILIIGAAELYPLPLVVGVHKTRETVII